MDDSFFGFDTSVPLDDDGGGGRIAEPSEEEYDALNDETFGSAINGDWEEVHENLVRLGSDSDCAKRLVPNFGGRITDNVKSSEFRNVISSAPSSGGSTPAFFNSHLRNVKHIADSDLELNLSAMRLDDVDLAYDDNVSVTADRINLDPSVWASHPLRHHGESGNDIAAHNHNIFQENFRSPFEQSHIKIEPNANCGLPPLPPAPKITTLEDIERNLIIQQKQRPDNKIFEDNNRHSSIIPTAVTQQQPHQVQKQSQPIVQYKVPPGFLPSSQTSPPRPNMNFTSNMAQHSNGVSGTRLPPGFPIYPQGVVPNIGAPLLPPHPLLNQHGGIPPNFPLGNQRPLPNLHLPTALNNFAMHPNFNAMRASAGLHAGSLINPPAQQPRLPPHPLQAANNLLNQQPNSMYNMFNMRLVQEIQQNHPLLQNSVAARNHQLQQQQFRLNSVGPNAASAKTQHTRRNGNLPQDVFDEYANLMSTRDKHWLIGIQLSQLNTDTPFIDDYYYTVYKERKALQNGDMRHSQAHKDNQLNHPLTQPRGHAQLILVQLGNKNGSRNGQNRERRNSENTLSGNNNASVNHDQKTPYVFTPLKFENSLGKLQYGSVTAPRKIIDADIMSADSISESDVGSHNAAGTYQSQSKFKAIGSSGITVMPAVGEVTSTSLRKSRHILLHIETLYRFILKLEDLENPVAITNIIMKKKKESERIAALEQLENANKTPEERAAEAEKPQTINPALKSKFTYELEPREALLSKLIGGLTYEKIVLMMNVRKGKALIRRIMPFIVDQNIRWVLWVGVFSSLQNVVKKDRDDVDGVLFALYPEFKKHISNANFETIVEISSSIILNDKKLTGIFCSRFGILSLVGLILRSEEIYVANIDAALNTANRERWRQFLSLVASSLNRTIQNQTISVAIESDSIQPMLNHFARFKDLKLDALLALITEAKQQID